jgi:hypothetical protein
MLLAIAATPLLLSGQAPPAPTKLVAPSGASFTAVTPQYNFSYGPDLQQPELPSSGIWDFYMPAQVTSSTPGWTTGMFGLEGLPDTFYDEPAYTTGGVLAGGCSWNADYDSPPFWYFDGGASTDNEYELLSGPILRSEAAIGSVYQSSPAQVAGTGIPLAGFGAIARWNPHVYTSAPYLVGALYFATNSCYSGDAEYGFAHFNYYNPAINQFYFYNYSNCSAPTGQTDSYSCYLTASQTEPQPQCSAAVNLPALAPNSKGTDWYFWYAYVDRNRQPPYGNGHYVLTAGVLDPYTLDSMWECVGDPLESPTFPVSTCPQTESESYQCDTPYPTAQLDGIFGSVTAGITNTSNLPPTGRVNPMLQMQRMFITEP